MTADQSKRLAQLQAAFASGLLDEDTYQAAIAGLQPAMPQAGVSGTDTIAQNQGTAAGDHSVATGRDIRKSVIITGNANLVHLVQHYQSDVAPTVDADQLARQIADYLVWVYDRFGTIELRGVHREGRQVVQLDLETVYIPLAAISHLRYGANREIELNQVLEQGNRLIITGGPGSGKTTVLQHIAWALASAIVTNQPELAATKLGLRIDDKVGKKEKALPLPLFVPLSAYAQDRRNQTDPQQRTLAAFISRYLIERQSGLRLPADFFVRLLDQGRGIILLLDGLDEVPDEHERAAVRQAIEDLVTGREELRILVTCRTAAYNSRTALGKGFVEVQVQPLSQTHIERLVHHAYTAIYPDDATTRQHKVDELLTGIEGLETERRRRLGEKAERLIDSPLLIRMLLIVHLSERRMPEHRAELYMRATENILWPQYLLDEDAATRIGRLVGGSHETHRELVQYLAFAMHRRGDQQGREIEEHTLRAILGEAPEFKPFLNDFVALTRLRGTLLEERLGVYRFVHLAFQEFLTARYLAEVTRSVGGIEAIARFLEQGPILESWWREPILLVAGYLSLTAPSAARQLLLRLSGATPALPNYPLQSPDTQIAATELAITACLEWLSTETSLRTKLAMHLVGLLTDANLTILQRSAFGDLLGKFGDPRPGVGVKAGLPDLAWSEPIQPGVFLMGEQEDWAGRSRFICDLIGQPYRISRYPITVAQYQTFVAAGGYDVMRYWTEAGWTWRTTNQITGAEIYASAFQTLNHPQVGVSWYEAVAFCAWLSDQTGQAIRLPTEPEWERAARHTDGRLYPWGNAEDPDQHCNMSTTGIRSTSAVGLFPSGDAFCNAADMAGNIWEWCNSQWLADYTDYAQKVSNNLAGDRPRVLRGGSFIDRLFIQCAGRFRINPYERVNDVGFRVLSTSS